MMKDVGVVIAAAGSGTRFGSSKQFELLGELPLYQYVTRTFAAIDSVRAIVLVGRDEDVPAYESGLRELNPPCEWHVVAGGATRQESVAKGLEVFCTLSVGAGDDIEILLVHDAARALVDQPLIETVIQAVREHGSAVPALPVVDTLKRTEGERIVETVSREHLWRAQTPQGARFELMLAAYDVAPEILRAATDEAQLLERIGEHPYVVHGSELNFKITYPADLERARKAIGSRSL